MSRHTVTTLRRIERFVQQVAFEEMHDHECASLQDTPTEVFECDCWKASIRLALEGKDPYS